MLMTLVLYTFTFPFLDVLLLLCGLIRLEMNTFSSFGPGGHTVNDKG